MDASDTIIPMSIPETERIAPELRTIGKAKFSLLIIAVRLTLLRFSSRYLLAITMALSISAPV